ncbi:hypothetical protein QL374_004646 [Salmonella enterica]|nr:hypothetical protein [Salmonella enterica]EKS3674610.1 hypothetical protein [Salmonella enterica]ELW6564243.1 hypothetical protein [Salmonella enterica]ELZ1403812.1 hypothetical protein [Salmonella enterica]
MNNMNNIRIVDPSMSVESHWLDEIITANTPLLVLRNFLKPELRKAVVEDLQQCKEKIQVSHYPNGALTTLGPYLAKYISAPENYFTELHNIQPFLPDSLITLQKNVYQWVKQVLRFETLETASEVHYGSYSGSIVRFHADGVANPLHSDHIVRDAADTDLAVTEIRHQLSCVVCLQECNAGGVLRIYNKKWSPQDECFKIPDELGYRDGIKDGCDSFDYSPQSGDIYIFNPVYYHEIDRVVGDTRITMGFFFGITDRNMKQAIAWS